MRKYFAFSLHKSGSTLMFNLLRGAAQRSQRAACGKRMQYLSIPDDLFNAGIPESVMFDRHFASPVDLDQRDTIYGGFRFVPAFIEERHLADAGLMMLVRDPRDLLTSLYYSVTKSHVLPKGEAGRAMSAHRTRASAMAIDDFVLEQARGADWIERFRKITAFRGRAMAWRYEDVIFDKNRWLDEILEYLEVDLPKAHRKALLAQEDVIPSSERPEQHIRQVAPGDHRRKLRPETIETLNAIFTEPLGAWGYFK